MKTSDQFGIALRDRKPAGKLTDPPQWREQAMLDVIQHLADRVKKLEKAIQQDYA